MPADSPPPPYGMTSFVNSPKVDKKVFKLKKSIKFVKSQLNYNDTLEKFDRRLKAIL